MARQALTMKGLSDEVLDALLLHVEHEIVTRMEIKESQEEAFRTRAVDIVWARVDKQGLASTMTGGEFIKLVDKEVESLREIQAGWDSCARGMSRG